MGLVLCSAFLFLTLSSKAQVLDPGQVYTTGNIVQNTPYGGPTPWVGGVYQDQLTCWMYGDPGYCGPSGIVRPGNNINFSYGSSYLYQQQNVTGLLPSATGLLINGYNFGFTAKNGNGWDDGRTDSLTALVRFWDSTGGRGATNLLYGNAYNLNYNFNWTNFNFSETFTSPLSVASIGQVQYGFLGRDNNGWAGPYGPEIRDISFSLKYSVDPCMANVMSSPTCPGYLEALAKLTPPAPTTTTVIDPVVVASTSITSSTTSAPAPVTETTSVSQPVQTTTQTSTPVATQQASISQSAPSSTPAKIGEVTDSTGSSKSTVSLSSVLSMIGSNQEKTAALEKSVVQAADAQAFAAGEAAKQTAEKVAGEAQSQSIAMSNSQASGGVQGGGVSSFSSPMQGSGIAIQGNLASNTFLSSKVDTSGASALSSTTMSGVVEVQRNNNATSTFETFTTLTPVVSNVPKTAQTISTETTSFASSVYTPPKVDSVAESIVTESSTFTPVKVTSTVYENNVSQSSTYVYKAPPSSIADTVEVQSVVPTSTSNRFSFEVKQDTTSTGSVAIAQPSRYEPPKVETNIAPSPAQGIQYQPPVMRQETVVAMVTPQASYNLVTPTKPTQTQVEMPALEGIKFGHKGPVDNAMESKPFTVQTNTENQQTEAGKKNVQNNELAGGVTIESIARQPANYAQYFVMMPDVAFYQPKEIYKNQKTIDNARAMRLLSSDRLHQEMVNQQYK